jgi:hypothetical protein
MTGPLELCGDCNLLYAAGRRISRRSGGTVLISLGQPDRKPWIETAGGIPQGRGGGRASAALPLLDDVTTSPASRRLASARRSCQKMNRILREALKMRGASYGSRERSEVFQSGSQDAEYHGPVDFLVGMNGYVSESYGSFHASSEIPGNHSEPFQLLKCFCHGGGCGEIRIGDNMGGEIDANLNSTLQIDADNILEIPIVQQ